MGLLASGGPGYPSVVPKGQRYRLMRLHQPFRYRRGGLAPRRWAQFLRDISMPVSKSDPQ